MLLNIKVPEIEKLRAISIPINISELGTSWSKRQLGTSSNASGVYVHFNKLTILYVGQTTSGSWATFGERLRREFQESSSQDSDLFRLLQSQQSPVYTALLDLNYVDTLVSGGPKEFSKERKALILEQVLIATYDPIGNKK